MRHERAALHALAILAAAFLMSGCGAKAPEGQRRLVVWSSAKELEGIIGRCAGTPALAGTGVEFEYKTGDDYRALLSQALSDGSGLPDIIAVDSAWVREFADSGRCADLGALKGAFGDDYPFVVDSGRDSKGRVMALSWEIAPGGYFYKRSIAKKYLGTDDPAKIQSLISDNAKFMATAEALKTKSSGRAVMVASLGDVFRVFKASRKDGWTRDGALVIDPAMVMLLDQAKLLRESGYEAGAAQMDQAWFKGLGGETRSPDGRSVEVLGYFLPAWGLERVIKPNAAAKGPGAPGDWALVQGPVPYSWGGTWLMVNASSKSKAQAMRLVSYVCCDRGFQEGIARDTGRPVSNRKAMQKLREGYSDPFLDGQNPMGVYDSVAAGLNGNLSSAAGTELDGLWQAQLAAFVSSEKDVQTAISDFKAEAKAALPGLRIE
jgi:ABC-type glycerol-3-phosphate transport system substrate-binding protein